jgi:hypothetical protein
MERQLVQCRLHLDAGPDTDPEELERLTQQLRSELEQLPVEEVTVVTSLAAPEDDARLRSKSLDVIHVGALIVTLIPAKQVWTVLLDFLKGWAGRFSQRRIRLEINGQKIDVAGLTAEQQQHLLDEFHSSTKRVAIAHE